MIQSTRQYASGTNTQSTAGAPTIRIRSWWREAVILTILGAIAAVAYLLDQSGWSLIGVAACFFIYSRLSRLILTRSHRTGIRLVRRGQYEQAIPYFAASYDFFSRYPWLDNLRVVTMLSPSALNYREMALCNMAFCHSQIGNGATAKEIYGSVIAAYPGNPLASIGLRMIEAGQQIAGVSPTA